MADCLATETNRTGDGVVYRSGLENLDGNLPETAESADACGLRDAQDATFTPCSDAGDGTWVGTYPWSVPVAEFLTQIIHELSPSDFARFRRTEPASPNAKYTYFARCLDTGNIKIGRSLDPKARMVQIKRATGKPHELLATIRGGENESSYHVAFFPLRLHGEWFPPHPDILAEIDRLKGCAP